MSGNACMSLFFSVATIVLGAMVVYAVWGWMPFVLLGLGVLCCLMLAYVWHDLGNGGY